MKDHQSGSEAAQDDWRQRRARHLTTRTFQRKQPALLTDSLFYYSSVGAVDWGPKFCDDYNAEISRMIDVYGVPTWAPGLRRLSAAQAQKALREHEVENWDNLTREQQRVVENVSRLGGPTASISAMAHVPGNEVFVVARTMQTAQRVCLDIIDLLELRYMSRYIMPSDDER
ncbi:hypothetical protein [Enhygromyxa salina]|uniref:hypothetical protein n=1 Tax=Enhygromyxa salina TaxID=215803 RepID=UPI0011BADF23|nr:hypothetical protein [Enhygromyxa salina]